MPTLTIEYHTDTERLAIEQAIAYVQQLHQLAITAAPGTVLAACEPFALADGRKLLQNRLAAALQARTHATDIAPKKFPNTTTKVTAHAGS